MTSELCGYEYSEFGDDGWCLDCELPKGHEGKHRLVMEWATRPADVCKAEGHVWGDWQAFTDTKPNLFVSPRDWKVEPERWRRCERCKRLDFEGGERNQDLSDILIKALVDPLRIPYGEFAAKATMKWGVPDGA